MGGYETANLKTIRKVRESDWEFGIRCKLVYIEWTNDKVLLYRTGNYVQYSVITHNGKEYEKACIYICITESHHCTMVIKTTL